MEKSGHICFICENILLQDVIRVCSNRLAQDHRSCMFQSGLHLNIRVLLSLYSKHIFASSNEGKYHNLDFQLAMPFTCLSTRQLSDLPHENLSSSLAHNTSVEHRLA
jgi:hypothetical protein